MTTIILKSKIVIKEVYFIDFKENSIEIHSHTADETIEVEHTEIDCIK